MSFGTTPALAVVVVVMGRRKECDSLGFIYLVLVCHIFVRLPTHITSLLPREDHLGSLIDKVEQMPRKEGEDIIRIW